MDERLLTEFLAEAEDAVEELYGELAALRAPRSEGRARRESLARLFRRVHTLKGSASTAGLAGVASLAHEFESLLEAARAGRLALDARAVELFGETVAALEESLERAARGESAPPPRDLVERLRGLAPAQGDEAAGVDETRGGAGLVDESFAGEASASLDAAERGRLRAAVAEGARACAVTVSFPLEDFDERFRLLSDALSEAGEIISTLPLTMPDAPERVGFRVLYATRETRAQTAERAARFGASVEELGARPNEPKERESARHASQGASVRVALDDLDDLISSAHAVFNDALAALEAAAGGDADERAARVRRSFYEVEERLIALRMTTARRTLERAARAGSRVARAEGREVDFEIVGGDVRLDRSVAELVADPLLHLVRNAVVHGLETPEERRAAGKSGRGRVRVEASGGGGRVRLRVADDGRGVDPALVERAARSRGLAGEGERMTEERALRLIFRPGFTTAARASESSGRGVGLDVVERAVEDAGGEVRVRSRRGEGSTFELNLPARLALTRALFVRDGGRLYCVDSAHVLDVREAGVSEVERRGREEFVRPGVGDEVMRLVRLRELLGRDEGTKDAGGGDGGVAEGGKMTLVVTNAAGRGATGAEGASAAGGRVAVAVEAVEGRGEILVRGLGRHAGRWRGVAGATELRDGTVALLLDLQRLLE